MARWRRASEQERIRVVIGSVSLAVMIGLAIASGTWASWALVAIQIAVSLVMIPERV